MNSFIAGILSLKGTQLDSLIEIFLVFLIIGAYIIPLLILIHDLRKRYDDKFTRLILSSLAALSLPLFIIPYILFRKETTLKEDDSIGSELNILTTTNNCIKCVKCSEINRSDYNYCIKCGNLLIALCKNCGQNIDLNWAHCGFCGVNLKPEPVSLSIETLPKLEPIKIEESKTNEPVIKNYLEIGTSILKNKKIIYAIGHKLNSLITPSTEVYK